MAKLFRVLAVASIVTTWSGQPAVAQDINLATGGADLTWKGTQPNAGAGVWLDQGAVSDDSRRDLIVGSPGTSSIPGAVYVLFGGPVRSGEFVLSAAETVITSSEAGNLFGRATAAGNILNTEGTTPRALVVGAPGAQGGRGAVYLFPGGFTTPSSRTTDDAVFRVIGASGDQLGTALATGDLDNDGYREIIIGAPGTGRVYIVRGGPSLSGTLDLSTGSAAARITAAGIGSVLAAGDITNDNIPDLLIGAPSANLAFLFTGMNGTIRTAADGSFYGLDADDLAGASFRIGDFDGDGKRDLVVTAPQGDGPNNDRANAGEAYLFWGPVATGARFLSVANVVFHGATAGMRTGKELTGGDINRDTPNDLVLLSPGNSSGAGQLEIYYGRSRSSFGTLQPDGRRFVDFAAAGQASRRIFGDPSVGPIASAQVYEVTGEGARDIIVGVPAAESGAGKLYFTISPKLRINPTSLSFYVNENGSATIPTPIDIVNPSTVFIGWEATANQSWLSTSPGAGSADHSHPAVMYVTASAQGLAPGVQTGLVTVASTSPDLEMALGVDVTMNVTGVRMALDTPVHGAEVATTFTVAGWAVDVSSTTGTGISLVEIWAYPNPGSGAAPVLVGAANYGGARPDVGSLYGSRFTNSAYTLSVSSLAPGKYQIAAFAKSSVSNAFMLSRTAVVTVVTSTPSPTPDPDPGPNPNPGPTPNPDPIPIPDPGPEPPPGPNPDTRIALNRTNLNFGVVGGTNGARSGAQQMTVGFTSGSASWTVATDVPWLELSPTSGNVSGTVDVNVKAGTYSAGVTLAGNIVVTAPGVANSPVSLPVTLRVYASAGNPIGVIETPSNGATGVVGATPVTGWALDEIGVKEVTVWRDPVAGETSSSPNGKIFIGRATKVDGARPDVDTIYDHPFDYNAGWGYMLLTNMLPNQGNGSFTLHIYAEDFDGRTVSLGARSIVCDNANAKKPFGTIDTPDQGGTVGGSTYTNFGWALTPSPNAIPTDGSTIMVFIDGVPVGRPVYNQPRNDVATLFPGRANSDGAVGYFHFDTTRLANGVHTIAWSVSDNAGNADGIGSRFFTVLNGNVTSSLTLDAAASIQAASGGGPEVRTAAGAGGDIGGSVGTLASLPISGVPVYTRTGFDPGASLNIVDTDGRGVSHVTAAEASRFEITLGSPVTGDRDRYEGYLVANDRLQPLPAGAFLDRKSGEFYWQPGVGFVGSYDLVFVRSADGMRERIPVRVTITPRAGVRER